MSGLSTKALIEQAVRGVQAEVPALEPLKLVVGLELRGRGDLQPYRVELPGPKVTKGPAADARVHVSVARSHFNQLAVDGTIGHWRDAIEAGQVRVTGPDQLLKLIANVVARQGQRARTRNAR